MASIQSLNTRGNNCPYSRKMENERMRNEKWKMRMENERKGPGLNYDVESIEKPHPRVCSFLQD